MNERKKSIEIIEKKINKIKSDTKYIQYIRFPKFKNFEKNLKVNFEYPLTVVVGKNGSGKSGLLHALFGAPEYKWPRY